MSRHQDFNVITLIHYVLPTSDSLDAIFEYRYPDMDWMSDMTEEELKVLDSKVFQCQCCGWWHRQEDRNVDDENEWTCNDCK